MRRRPDALTLTGLGLCLVVLVALMTVRYGPVALAYGGAAGCVALVMTWPWEALAVAKSRGDAVVGGERLDALRPGVSDHTGPQCDGGPCPAHNQSRHHMLGWPQWHGRVMNLTVRECPHGALHPDPDDVRWSRYSTEAHAAECDGCCRGPAA